MKRLFFLLTLAVLALGLTLPAFSVQAYFSPAEVLAEPTYVLNVGQAYTPDPNNQVYVSMCVGNTTSRTDVRLTVPVGVVMPFVCGADQGCIYNTWLGPSPDGTTCSNVYGYPVREDDFSFSAVFTDSNGKSETKTSTVHLVPQPLYYTTTVSVSDSATHPGYVEILASDTVKVEIWTVTGVHNFWLQPGGLNWFIQSDVLVKFAVWSWQPSYQDVLFADRSAIWDRTMCNSAGCEWETTPTVTILSSSTSGRVDFRVNNIACDQVKNLNVAVMGFRNDWNETWFVQWLFVVDCRVSLDLTGYSLDGRTRFFLPDWPMKVDNQSPFWRWNQTGGYFEQVETWWVRWLNPGDSELPIWVTAQNGQNFGLKVERAGWYRISVIDGETDLTLCDSYPCPPEARVVAAGTRLEFFFQTGVYFLAVTTRNTVGGLSFISLERLTKGVFLPLINR